MLRPLIVALVAATFSATSTSADAAHAAPADEAAASREEHDAREAASARDVAMDPVLPAAIVTTSTGALVGLLGLSLESTPLVGTRCDGARCEGEQDDRDLGVALAAGGATTALGGAALLALHLAAPEDRPSAGRARAAAGGLALSLGAGMLVAGAAGRASDVEPAPMDALLVTGALTSAVGAPVLGWGLATMDDAEDGTAYVGEGRMVTGLALTSVGALATAGAVVVQAQPCGSEMCGLRGLVTLPALVGGVAAISVGLPLYASGANVEPQLVPDVHVGAGTVHAAWRLP